MRAARVRTSILLQHLNATPEAPERVVVLGKRGSVASALARLLEARKIPCRLLGKSELDLLASDAPQRLSAELGSNDALVVISALAPCKNADMLVDNVRMMAAICAALERQPVAHAVYISSDAVYRDSTAPLTEASCAEPNSMHGGMHIAREIMLRGVSDLPLAVLRPTLLFGPSDTHDGYGPNRFLRFASEGREIVLFGEGEERRDHVFLDDLAELLIRVLTHRSVGLLNVATGEVVSFRALAELIAQKFGVTARGTPRTGPMPHGGYRPFEISTCRTAFPDFRYTPLQRSIAATARILYAREF